MSSMENDFLMSLDDTEQFKGQWIAILDKEIIAKGKVLSDVYSEAIKKSGGRTPLFEHIPTKLDKQTLIL